VREPCDKFRGREIPVFKLKLARNRNFEFIIIMEEGFMLSLFRAFDKIMILSLVLVLIGCSGFKKVKREITTPASFQKLPENQLKVMRESSPFLKVHMQNGNIYVLQTWIVDSTRQHVVGYGTLFNAKRDTLRQGQFQVGLDSVAIFETNVLKPSGAATALTVFTGITAAITIACITNPKACFGSCPTFYVLDGDSLRLRAEGFSASIAPSLEATDVDALFHASTVGEELMIEMRNEALERSFWESPALSSPISATGPEGDCLMPLLVADGNERYSRADSTDLSTKEIIELEFENISQQSCGLVIGCRQTLLPTYLLYQTFAYMGNNAGYWFAQIERKNVKQHQNSIQKIMGGIEILIQDSLGDWKVVDQVDEHGPLATDFHLVPMSRLASESAKIRLRMTKGNWRIDYVAFAVLSQPVQAIRIHPHLVLKDGFVDEHARAVLCDSTKALTTLPGDVYTLRYQMPGTSIDYELFLESRGYYLEWIRKEWIEEENPLLLAQMFLNPQAALKRLAPEFKQVEKEMEKHFWRSRYARPH
jgi:hypothetical protein